FAPRGQVGRLARGDLLRLAAAGVCLAAHFALWNASLGLTTVAAATTLVSCAPLFVGVGSVFMGEAPSPRAWAGIVLATAGAGVIGLGDAAGFGGGSGGVLGGRPHRVEPRRLPRRRPGWPWPGWWPAPSCSATPCSTVCWPP